MMVDNTLVDSLKNYALFDNDPNNEYEFYKYPSDRIRLVLNFAASLIPNAFASITTSLMINQIWPSHKVNLFETLKSQIKDLVDEEIDIASWNRLQTVLRVIEKKISSWQYFVSTNDTNIVYSIYTTLTNELTGIEKIFALPGRKRAYAFTPLYFTLVHLILVFRTEVINKASALGLTSDDVRKERVLLQQLVSGPQGVEAHHKEMSARLYSDIVDDCERNGYLNYKHNVEIYNSFIQHGLSDANMLLINTKAYNPSADPIDLDITLACQPHGVFTQGLSALTLFLYSIERRIDTMRDLCFYQMKENEWGGRYRRLCGVKYTDRRGAYYKRGYFGQHDIQAGKHCIYNLGTRDPIVTGVCESQGIFPDKITVTTRSGRSLSVGTTAKVNTRTVWGDAKGPYRIAKIICTDDGLTYKSGYQTMGIAASLQYDNLAGEKMALDMFKPFR